MFSWGLVVDNPYYDVTKEDGRFEISDIPPGEYTLAAWHPGVHTVVEQRIQSRRGQTVNAHIVFQAPQGRRSAHEMAENPRFGLELLGDDENIVPSLRAQIP